MRTSLIITTYNWKEALALCLMSAFRQTRVPDEIIVADDGSREDTAELIRDFASRSPVPLLHSWQPDEGFRASSNHNRAIAKASGDYIISIDGDLLLHRRFCADHIRNARRGYWLRGSRTFLTPEKTVEILRTGKTEIGFFSSGFKPRHRSLHFPLLGRVGKYSSKGRAVFGCNISFWRDDAIAVNGYNEAFVGWGREDSEFITRLEHYGVRRIMLHYQGLVFHLHHPDCSRDRDENNLRLWEETIRQKRIRCEPGLDQYLS